MSFNLAHAPTCSYFQVRGDVPSPPRKIHTVKNRQPFLLLSSKQSDTRLNSIDYITSALRHRALKLVWARSISCMNKASSSIATPLIKLISYKWLETLDRNQLHCVDVEWCTATWLINIIYPWVESRKTIHSTVAHIFTNCWPIINCFPPADSAVYLQ